MERGVSRQLGCGVVGLYRSASRRERKERRPEVRAHVLAHPEVKPRYSLRRVHALIGPGVNLKAAYRIWREEGVCLTTRKRKRIQVGLKPETPPAQFRDA